MTKKYFSVSPIISEDTMITKKFRSILVNNVEKVVPGTVFTKMVIEMDESTIAEHELRLSAGDILLDRSWILNFFLAFMTAGGISAIIFGLLYMGYGKGAPAESWNSVSGIFLACAVILFLSLWIFLSVRGAIAGRKREFVEKERGKGNWRIVDEAKWGEFYRLMQISKKSKEKELEDFMNKKLSEIDMK